jgi:hypothetical protein
MALWLVQLKDKSVQMVVRAPGKACARSEAADNAGPEGTAAWRNPDESDVWLIDPMKPVRGVILKALTAPS